VITADPIALAIDIGGTKIAVGLVDAGGHVLERAETATPATAGANIILAETVRMAETLRGELPIAAVGVASAGVIDASGRVTSATGTLTDWAGADGAGAMRASFGLPVALVNDVHAHAVGEAVFGAGRSAHMVLLVAAGTGIGGAIVTDGLPALGAHGAAGHLGHIPAPAAAGLVCSCGRVGHLEAVASGPGIHAAYLRAGGDPCVIDTRAVFELASHEGMAADVVRRSASALGSALGGLVNTVDPDVVVVGGGLSEAGDVWWRPLVDATRLDALPALESVPILRAELGTDAALAGAAHLALREPT
jgi:glucokinase